MANTVDIPVFVSKRTQVRVLCDTHATPVFARLVDVDLYVGMCPKCREELLNKPQSREEIACWALEGILARNEGTVSENIRRAFRYADEIIALREKGSADQG